MADEINVSIVASDSIAIAAGGGDSIAFELAGSGVTANMTSQEAISAEAVEETIECNLTVASKEEYQIEKFVATALQVLFTITITPRINSVWVFVNGVLQEVDVDYTLSGKNITFASGLSAGDKVEIRYVKA